jgi:oxaloacetate decarboxylase beta subunit
MPDTKKTTNTKIAFIMLAILAVAGVFSFASNAFAQSSEVKPHMVRVIKGTENWNGKYDISFSKFVKNIGKSTGLYMMIHRKSADEIAQEKAQAEALLEAEEESPFEEANVPGWQYLVMIVIGFVIIYLAVGKGFEPLLLIPIGFGTVLVNIPGAGMGNPPHGMLNIIYNAGVGNEFFPMLISVR